MPEANKIKTYIVDDQPSMRLLLRDNLRSLGIKDVTEFGDGQEALTALHEKPAHLVISDCEMPNLDGMGLLRAVRSDAALARTAFIMVTSRAENHVVREAAALKVNNYIVKPISFGQLKAKIEAVFGALT
jgi:two-component system chemotaxis response regulator CheY